MRYVVLNLYHKYPDRFTSGLLVGQSKEGSLIVYLHLSPIFAFRNSVLIFIFLPIHQPTAVHPIQDKDRLENKNT